MKKSGVSKKIITFQEIIERLNRFWGSHGCVIGQPYGLEVGAGTSNPNTFLRSLGREPFNVAYVEPSRRPDDGRYGQNPYRLQHYFQYQIILKPAPKNNQELYLESLNALGIDNTKHDIRFVEDNWESPAIGAWGLGWEVWLDGMEITQYTYFQQVAGIPLEVPVLEITLGLERLAMYIQEVDDYRDIMFNEQISYGDLFEQHEYWQSKYNYETADIDDLEKIYSLMKSQIEKQLRHGNYWVAYDYLLKISHIFNILDSRGVISVTDRISRFDVMGKLANKIGELYLDERQELGYPMDNKMNPIDFKLSKEVGRKPGSVTKSNKLVLELCLEEMPGDFIKNWRENYYRGDGVELWLKELGLKFESVRTCWSSRRIVLEIDGCADYGEIVKEVYGPVYDMAFSDGKINKVGLGFLKKHGAKEKDIVKVERGEKVLLGISLVEKYALNYIVEQIIEKFFNIAPQSKKMKWLEGQTVGFIRPLRNIFCFKDERKIDVEFWGVKSTGYIFCSRGYPKHTMSISSAQAYLKGVKDAGILIDESYREALIREIIDAGKERYDYSAKTEQLIKLNTFLSEYPNTKFFTLDDKYSELPIELISKVLEENQKYIIRTLKEDSTHVEYGIVADKKGDASRIFQGNRKVISGRLDDALFYWERDVDVTLKSLRKDLRNIVFHPQVGSYQEKVLRIKKLVNTILENYEVKVKRDVLEKAIDLIKNDKATNMVKEFASLEGVIGMYYAKREGYSSEVANLLYEHYLPISEDSAIPSTNEAVLLSLADKLDNILVFSKVGGLPQGSSDPYEIRKNVYSLIRLLRESKIDVDLYEIIGLKEVVEFLNQRIYQIMKSECKLERVAKGIAYSEEGNISRKFEYLAEMKKVLSDKKVEDRVFDTLKRVYNILEKSKLNVFKMDESLLETVSEKELYNLVKDFEEKRISVHDLLKLSNLLENFFEETMVNVEDKHLKQNRLFLLMKLRDLLRDVIVI